MAALVEREVLRKSIHMSTLFLLLIYFVTAHYVTAKFALLVLVFILAGQLLFEFFRLDLGFYLMPKSLWKFVARRKESTSLGAHVFVTVGMIIPLAAFNTYVAVAAILMLIFGDAAAALIGRCCGRFKLFKKKTWEGTIAGFVINMLIGYYLLPIVPAVGMAVSASVVELFVSKVDDNLAVPIFAGIVGQLLYLL